MFCMKCGQQLPDRVRFCVKCGTAQADIKLKELSDRLDRQAAELEAVRKELRAMQPENRSTASAPAVQPVAEGTAAVSGTPQAAGTTAAAAPQIFRS